VLNNILEKRHAILLISVLGNCLSVLCVVMFLNVNSIPERFLWTCLWLICCKINDKLFKNFNKQKSYKLQ